MDKLAIVGIGNTMRSDDSAGWEAIALLEEKIKGNIPLHKIRGDTAALLDLFEKYEALFIIDAAVYDDSALVLRVDALHDPIPFNERITSSHGMGLHAAVELGIALSIIPKKLIIYAVKASVLSIAEQRSQMTEQGITEAVDMLLKEEEIKVCMKKR